MPFKLIAYGVCIYFEINGSVKIVVAHFAVIIKGAVLIFDKDILHSHNKRLYIITSRLIRGNKHKSKVGIVCAVIIYYLIINRIYNILSRNKYYRAVFFAGIGYNVVVFIIYPIFKYNIVSVDFVLYFDQDIALYRAVIDIASDTVCSIYDRAVYDIVKAVLE